MTAKKQKRTHSKETGETKKSSQRDVRNGSIQRIVRPIELTLLGEELYRRGCRETAPDGIITEEFLNRFGMSFGEVQ